MSRISVAFIKYCSVAVGATLCDWFVFIALDWLGVSYVFAQMTSRIFGGVFSFFVNRGWTFDARDGGYLTRKGRRFLLLYAFSYCLSISLLYVFVDMIGVPMYIAKILADSTCLVINFVTMRTYVFKDRAGFTSATQKILTELFERNGGDKI
jgi:putative flippase GtrA